MERKAQLRALAQRLVRARNERKVIDFLGGADAPRDEAEAYAVQFAKHEEVVKSGDSFAGWKVAASIPAQYQPIGLTGPALGGLFKSGMVKSGTRFPAGWPIKPGVECEIAMRLTIDAKPMAHPYTAQSIRPLVAAIMQAMEVVDNRYSNLPQLNGLNRIADDFLQHACVLGPEIHDVNAFDLVTTYGRSSLNGKELAGGTGANVMGDPFIALAWLANRLIALGTCLKAGEIVMTGSCHIPQFLSGPGEVVSGFEGVGEVKAVFA